jgi:pyruvate dehydrogenase E2 component (dihydrolipoamide acetyltransferase)
MNILMPQLGETVAEGKITQWFKSAGDKVAPGDNLFEIETDKVSMEVPATEAGVLNEIRVPAGETAPVGAVVGVIGDSAGAAPSAPAKIAPLATKASPAPSASPSRPPTGYETQPEPMTALSLQRPIKLDPFNEVRTPERNFGTARLFGGVTITPLARRLANETGIDLAKLRGSGPHGRIVAQDVQNAPRPAGAALAESLTAEQVKALYDPAGYEEVPLDGMRKTIAARLQQAKQTIPHFYLTADIVIACSRRARKPTPLRRRTATASRRSSCRSTISSFARWRLHSSACQRRMPFGQAIASCGSRMRILASPSRSTAD